LKDSFKFVVCLYKQFSTFSALRDSLIRKAYYFLLKVNAELQPMLMLTDTFDYAWYFEKNHSVFTLISAFRGKKWDGGKLSTYRK